MKTIIATILSLLIAATQALAIGSTGTGTGPGLLATFAIAFGILIVLFQSIPALMLFGGMIKGMFSSTEKKIN